MNRTEPRPGPVFVTGASGFIGSAFVAAAAARGLEVVALTRGEIPTRSAAGVRWVRGALGDVPAGAVESCRSVVHLAAAGVVAGGEDWDQCFEVNVRQSFAFWRTAVAAGVREFVICGSCSEYGRAGERYARIPVTAPLEPVTPYGATKAAATNLALGLAAQAELTLSVLRPFQVYGAGEAPGRFWPSLRAAAIGGYDYPMTAGTQVRDFTPVSLVAERFLEEVLHPSAKPGRPTIHNVSGGDPRTVEAFARFWWKELGAPGKLLVGELPMRSREVERYVAEID